MINPNDTVLFQGDSITDAGRLRDVDSPQPNHAAQLGQGYASYAAAMLLAEHHELNIYNRGASGNRVTDLADRWQADCLDLKPDVLSILIGVNDTWHGTAAGNPDKVIELDRYESVYRKLLDQALEVNPKMTIVLCEPFTTNCGVVAELKFYPELAERQKIVKDIAEDYDAVFLPFQAMFDQASQTRPPQTLAHDGVHPSMAGHYLMARQWVNTMMGV